MEVTFERVAGIDIGKAMLTVCVRILGDRGRRHSQTRTFKTTFGSLRVMRDWLVDNGVQVAAIESTSTYWKPPYYCLEEVMDVWLLNAAHMKAVPGRKAMFGMRSGSRSCWSTGCCRRRSCRRPISVGCGC